jgi:hypothetical protein
MKSLDYADLGHLLYQIGKHEFEIETLRNALAMNPHFEPYTAFKRINRLGDPTGLSQDDLIDFLTDN